MLPNFTKRQWLTLVVFSIADFCNAICVSLQAPFYPQEVSIKYGGRDKTEGQFNRLSKCSCNREWDNLQLSEKNKKATYDNLP